MARNLRPKKPTVIKLSPIEQMELRVLDAMRLAADADLQVKLTLLKNRAHQIAAAHGIDLSQEAQGSWDLRIDEGTIQQSKE